MVSVVLLDWATSEWIWIGVTEFWIGYALMSILVLGYDGVLAGFDAELIA